MAMRIFLKNTTNKCTFSNMQFHRINFQFQSALFYNQSSRKLRTGTRYYFGQGYNRSFWKSVAFAITFSGATYVGATILEYERIRANKNKFDGMQWRPYYDSSSTGWNQIKNQWINLNDAEKVFYSLFTANVLVFLAWKVPKYQQFMIKYFTNHWASNAPYLSSILSMFSHYNIYHLFGNMFALYSFSMSSVPYLGREHFLALYLTSGVISNIFSNAYKIFTNQHAFSIGASGAIMGIVGFFCSQFPDTRLSIIFLPFLTFNANMALKSLLIMETAGCLLKWRYLDHAAHLSGILFGMLWCYWGIEHIWRKRTTIMTYWHALRDPPKSH